MRFSYLILALLILHSFLFLSGCAREGKTDPADKAVKTAPLVNVSVMALEPGPLKDVLVLPGNTQPEKDVRLSADLAGVVEWLGLEEGDRVEEGELVAKIEVRALEAALEQARASLELSQSLFERKKNLFEHNVGTREALDRALTDKVLAEGNLKRAEVEYERGFIRAPIGGRVDRVFPDQGEFVGRGDPVADLVSVDRIKVRVNVPEMDVRFFNPGQKVRVTIDALPGFIGEGEISHIAFKADPATKTFLVDVLVDNPEKLIRPGMIARVAFLRRVIQDALSVPLFSIVDKGGERLVFIEQDNVAHARKIGLGVISGPNIHVVSGLAPGDRLIVAGQKDVEEGMKVNVR